MYLLYATDFADRLEQDVIPALRAGFVVLTDRYLYSIIARAQARGVDPAWLRSVFGFALIPDAVFYLQADLVNLIPRVLNVRGFDYWESGVDFLSGRDYYDSFAQYQSLLLAQFDAIADEFNFVRVDANGSILDVFRTLRDGIRELIKGMKPPKELVRKLEERQAEAMEKERQKAVEKAAPAKSKDADPAKHAEEPEKGSEEKKAGQPARDESPEDGAEETTRAEEISEAGPRWKEWLERLRPSH
jgi:thymidylate kinase